jgi:hypothetical protein
MKKKYCIFCMRKSLTNFFIELYPEFPDIPGRVELQIKERIRKAGGQNSNYCPLSYTKINNGCPYYLEMLVDR